MRYGWCRKAIPLLFAMPVKMGAGRYGPESRFAEKFRADFMLGDLRNVDRQTFYEN